MKPDLLMLGDSHTIALEDGAKRLGLAVEVLRFGGGGWHEGKFGWGPDGLVPKGSPMGRHSLEQLREKLGVQNIFSLGLPIVTTIGFHLALMVRPMGWFGHQMMPATGEAPKTGLLMSSAFVSDYIDHYRAAHLRVLRRLSREAKVIVVPPPVLTTDPQTAAVRGLIIGKMRALGLEVFDPMAELLPEEPVLPARFLGDDPNHATADYGEMVISALRTAGKI